MKKLYQYENLILKFVKREISVQKFEQEYFNTFLKEDEFMDDNLYFILQELFAHIDSFTDLPMTSEDNPDDYINEEELRGYALDTLVELDKLK